LYSIFIYFNVSHQVMDHTGIGSSHVSSSYVLLFVTIALGKPT